MVNVVNTGAPLILDGVLFGSGASAIADTDYERAAAFRTPQGASYLAAYVEAGRLRVDMPAQLESPPAAPALAQQSESATAPSTDDDSVAEAAPSAPPARRFKRRG